MEEFLAKSPPCLSSLLYPEFISGSLELLIHKILQTMEDAETSSA